MLFRSLSHHHWCIFYKHDISAGHQESTEHEEGERGQGLGLDFLRQLPQFEQLRELVQSNPAILPQIIQQIAQSNPALMEAIQNNQVLI